GGAASVRGVGAHVVAGGRCGLGVGDGGGAHRVGEAGLLVHLPHDLRHAGEGGFVGVDDDVNAVSEHVEVAVGDEHGDLDEGVAPQVEPGHLAVDPHQPVGHGATLC